MRCVIQRSGPARVLIDGQTAGAIDAGLVVLAAFAPNDTAAELEWMSRKVPALRLFNDEDGKMNRALREVGGGILLVSQFTLYGDCRRGNRPSYVGSAPPDRAAELYALFATQLRRQWDPVAEGRFGAMMEVDLVNRGPVTLILDRDAPRDSTGSGEPA